MLTVKDAARYLGCTEWYVRTLVWEKKLSHLVFGKRYVFDRADLDAFVESQKVRVAA
jgi:excisionase family DNA binding protein